MDTHRFHATNAASSSEASMTRESPAGLSPPDTKVRKGKKNQPKGDRGVEGPGTESPKSMPWRESLAEEDPFSLLAGGEEGGFLSLEEVDELEYGFIGGIPEATWSADSKKRKHGSRGIGGAGSDDDSVVEDGGEAKKARKKKQKKKRVKVKEEKEKDDGKEVSAAEISEGTSAMESSPVSAHGSEIINIEDKKIGQFEFQNDDYRAWKKLKLHPRLMKSIRRLGFKEPTPIQKACIPAAVHEGKDVIGAAETGSGKTLAFGLPIIHCLLKECDKAARLPSEGQDSVEEGTCGSPLRALILAPTRELALQVSDHLKEIAKLTNIRVVPIVGGMASEKQERLLKKRPEIIVGTPGRLWELMSDGEQHLVELNSLSFFVLDEADRMIESGHFNELQSIIDMLPSNRDFPEPCSQVSESCNAVPSSLQKKRQTFVFSATIALSDNFRKKLKHGFLKAKSASSDSLSSIERLSERAGIRADVAIVDLTNASIVADKLEESFIECNEETKEAYLYYILSVHGHGRTIVFCTSIAALRRISSILRILDIKVWTLHAQMQQRARLKAIDRFRENENGVLVATDVAARGLDIPGVRTVIHYQLPHSAEVYIHRSGRTARAAADGCCIALISPTDRAKFFSLCKSLSKESLRQFPLVDSYMPEIMKRLSLARQIDKILRKTSQENVKKSWFERNAESVELIAEGSGSEEERVQSNKQKKISSLHLKELQQELNSHLAKPLQPRTLSHRFLAGAGLSPLLQRQLEGLLKQRQAETVGSRDNKRTRFVVIGQDCVEPLQALRSSGREICVNAGKSKETRRLAEQWKNKRRQDKKRDREQRRKEKRKLKKGN